MRTNPSATRKEPPRCDISRIPNCSNWSTRNKSRFELLQIANEHTNRLSETFQCRVAKSPASRGRRLRNSISARIPSISSRSSGWLGFSFQLITRYGERLTLSGRMIILPNGFQTASMNEVPRAFPSFTSSCYWRVERLRGMVETGGRKSIHRATTTIRRHGAHSLDWELKKRDLRKLVA